MSCLLVGSLVCSSPRAPPLPVLPACLPPDPPLPLPADLPERPRLELVREDGVFDSMASETRLCGVLSFYKPLSASSCKTLQGRSNLETGTLFPIRLTLTLKTTGNVGYNSCRKLLETARLWWWCTANNIEGSIYGFLNTSTIVYYEY